MNDIFLGLIAFGVLVMAAIQVGAIIVGVRTARRVEGMLTKLQADIRPIVDNLQSMSADAAQATARISAQVARLEKVLGDLSARIDETATAFRETVAAPIREAMAIVHGVKAAFSVLRGDAKPRKAQPGDDDDPLFIG
jgi:uncharacterized protein YukE